MKPSAIRDAAEIYFCTATIVGWQYVITSPDFLVVIIESLNYSRTEKGLRLRGYVIMPNHVHTIVSAAQGNPSGILRDYSRFTSRKVSDLVKAVGTRRLQSNFASVAKKAGKGNNYKIWQTGSHPEAIVSQPFYLQKLNYIHDNPVRKGFVDRAEHWRYSSARNYYLVEHSIIKVDMLE